MTGQAESAERTGKLVRVLREFEPADIPVSLVYPKQGQQALKLRAFLDFAGPRLQLDIHRKKLSG